MAAPGEAVHEATTPEGRMDNRAAQGAELGAVAGGGVGALFGAAAVALVPEVGPLLSAGLAGGIAVGAATGAAVGTFLGPFVALGMSKDQAHAHLRDLTAGRTLVVVRTGDRQEEAVAVLRGHGPVEIKMPGDSPAGGEPPAAPPNG
jgi:hypothetical protein